MRTIELGKSGLMVPAVAVGCMRFHGLEKQAAEHMVGRCLELGANFFDHADIYGRGECERAFAEAAHMCPSVREKMIIQSKCGIVPGTMYDFSREYLLKSVDGILKRLNTEYLDVLVLHRPDALMEPEEVAEAFDLLERSGKVRHFGVSNQRPMQIELLKTCVSQELLVDQLQLSIPFSNLIAGGLEVNMTTDGAACRDGAILDYCRLKHITIQTWSPFQAGDGSGIFIGSPSYEKLNQVMAELAEKYETTRTAIAAAWILRHPAKMQLIAGTTNERRLEEIIGACGICLTREEWYRLYLAAGHILP